MTHKLTIPSHTPHCSYQSLSMAILNGDPPVTSLSHHSPTPCSSFQTCLLTAWCVWPTLIFHSHPNLSRGFRLSANTLMRHDQEARQVLPPDIIKYKRILPIEHSRSSEIEFEQACEPMTQAHFFYWSLLLSGFFPLWVWTLALTTEQHNKNLIISIYGYIPFVRCLKIIKLCQRLLYY